MGEETERNLPVPPTEPKTPRLKVAVLLCGHLRQYRECFSSLQEHFLRHHDGDLFIHTWDNLNHNAPSWHGVTTDHDVNTNREEVLACYDPKALQIEAQTPLDGGGKIVFPSTPLDSLLNQWVSFYKCLQLKNAYQTIHGNRYDWCIKLRPDITLLQPLLLERYDSQQLHLSQTYVEGGNERDRGGTDMIFWGSETLFQQIQNMVFLLPFLLERYPAETLQRPESYWLCYLQHFQVPYHLSNYHYYSHFLKGPRSPPPKPIPEAKKLLPPSFPDPTAVHMAVQQECAHQLMNFHHQESEEHSLRPYDLVYSALFHENLYAYLDNLLNWLWASRHLKVLIVVSLTESLHKEYERSYPPLPREVILIRRVRDNDLPIWGNVNLFQEHADNYLSLLDPYIPTRYVTFMASNQLFIRPMDLAAWEQRMPTITGLRPAPAQEDYLTAYQQWYQSALNSSWTWYWRILRDEHFLAYCREHHMIPYGNSFEGLVVTEEQCLAMMTALQEGEISAQATEKGYVLEEIFPDTFLRNTFAVAGESAWPRFNYSLQWNWQGDPRTSLLERHRHYCKEGYAEQILTVKPVARNQDDPLRQEIRAELYAAVVDQ